MILTAQAQAAAGKEAACVQLRSSLASKIQVSAVNPVACYGSDVASDEGGSGLGKLFRGGGSHPGCSTGYDNDFTFVIRVKH